MTIQQTSSTTTARTLYVAGERGRRHALAQLRAKLGGTWAYGVGNAYSEDYTVLERSRIESAIYRNCGGRHTLVARIVMLPPTACASCDQPLDHHPLCLLHRRLAAWCDCGAATAHMVENERHCWTARPGERCPRGHEAVEALALADGLERRRCRSCDYCVDTPPSSHSRECDNSGNAGCVSQSGSGRPQR